MPQDVSVLKHREGVTYWSVEGRSILTAWTCRPYRGVLPLSENLDVVCHRQQAIKNQRSRGDLGWLYGRELGDDVAWFHHIISPCPSTFAPNAVFRWCWCTVFRWSSAAGVPEKSQSAKAHNNKFLKFLYYLNLKF